VSWMRLIVLGRITRLTAQPVTGVMMKVKPIEWEEYYTSYLGKVTIWF
jgi:hypothetical protein